VPLSRSLPCQFPVVGRGLHSPRSRRVCACAPAAPVKVGRRPPAQRVALTGAWHGAQELPLHPAVRSGADQFSIAAMQHFVRLRGRYRGFFCHDALWSARQLMTHNVTSPPSIDALQNDQSLRHASDIRLTGNMEHRPLNRSTLFRFNARGLDYLGPLFGFSCNKLAEFGRTHRRWHVADVV
jgi:hypothetical protein